MTPLRDFLDELARSDIKVWADGGTLRCSGPEHLMTAELRSQLAARKAELLAFLAEGQARGEAAPGEIARVPREGELPLSHGQERLWALAALQPDRDVYNTTTIFRLEGALDVAALERSLDEIRRRHEILRTTFPLERGRPVQRISPATPWSLPVRDITRDMAGASGQRERTLRHLLQAEVRQPFDVKVGPPWRAVLLRLGAEGHVLSFTTHHIIFDGWSKVVFLRELGQVYRAITAGQRPELPALPIQYADYASWQRQYLADEMPRQLAYWEKQLGGTVPELRLPRDHARSPATTSGGSSRTFVVPAAVTRSLMALSRREQATLYMTLLAAFGAWLYGYTAQLDQPVCSPVAARDRRELEGLIGYFNNIVVMRSDLSGDPTVRELIGRTRRVTLAAHEHHAVPFQRVAELPNLVRTPLTRAMFAYQDAPTRTLDLPGVVATVIDLRKETADFDLAMYMESAGDGSLSGVLEYHAELFREETVSRMLQDLQRVLISAAENPHLRLSELPRFGRGLRDTERLLADHSKVTEALVVPSSDHPGPVAYLVLNEDDVPTLEEIRRFIQTHVPDYLVPVAFVPLNAMPLTASGAVDRSALPPPRLAERPAGGYVAPRTALERELAQIWQRVLWLDREVGIHDHFLDLGGHSLLSVQLMIELKRQLGRPVPVEALSEWRTVADLARLLERAEASEQPAPVPAKRADKVAATGRIDPEVLYGLRTYTASWAGHRVTPQSLVIGLNTSGSAPALFWCLQGYGELTQLAKYVGPDQPVYGMRSGNKVMLKTDENNRALAAHYVSDILAVQQEGSFIVGGNCQAASIAFHIATQLMDAGHTVPLLFLMERFVPQRYPGRVALLFGKESGHNPYGKFHEPEVGWRKYYEGEVSIDIIAGAHGQFFREPNIQVLAEALLRRIDEIRKLTPGIPLDAVRPEFQILRDSAYRAKVTAPASWTAQPGAEIGIPIAITNLSSDVWRPSKVSGIFVANRWLNARGRVVKAVDGRSRLPGELPPGATAELQLTVRAPVESGRYMLELDLVDEGVAWFKDRGSAATRVRVSVGGRPTASVFTRFAKIRGILGGHTRDDRPDPASTER